MKKNKVQPKQKISPRASQKKIIKAAKHAATMDTLEYQEQRKTLVEKLGMRSSDFDNLVKDYRKKSQASVRASLDEITNAAKHVATLPRLESDEVRESVVPKLGIKFAEFDREVERLRKEIRIMDGRRITLTDAGNGQRFVNRNSDVIRSCRQLTKSGWFFWNNQRWVPDAVGDAMELARLTAVDIATHATTDYKNHNINGEQYGAEIGWSLDSLSDRALKAMLNQASQGTAICITADKFDTHPELLNCQNGTLHLNTGEFYPAWREDLLTQVSNVVYDPLATCPRWEQFISEALEGHTPTIEYVQRSTGYLLTGSQSEQCFFLIQGKPGTGKSTFWRVIRFMMGDYFEMVSAGLFVKPPRNKKSSGEEASPALVKLVGKRVAAEVELGEDDGFASTLLKRITGGESLTARPLYKEPFTFQPQCKPVFLTNHQPGTDDFSGGLEDRLRIIKFNVKFRGTTGENKNLVYELYQESSGILNWAIAGLREFHRRKSLDEPISVKDNVTKYFAEENIVARFLAENAESHAAEGTVSEISKSKLATFAQLYATFKHWAEQNEEEFGSAKWFGNRMTQLGHKTVVDRHNVKYYQFKLLFSEYVYQAA